MANPTRKAEEKIVFSISTNQALANALRRSANEILIPAIETVEFYKNDSVLYDEIIAHRLGLVPIKKEKLNEIEKCSCGGKGCIKCSIDLKLKAKGPCTAYSGDLRGKAKVIFEKMPIVILEKDQELELVARVNVGKAIQHAKFSPGLIYYHNLAEIETSKDCDLCKACVAACPKKLLSVDKKIEAKNIQECDLCEACVEACKKHGKNAINISPSKEIVFFVESFGQSDAKSIFIDAVKALTDNLKEFIKKIEK